MQLGILILIISIVAIGVAIWTVRKWKRCKLKYFSDDDDFDRTNPVVDIGNVTFSIEEEDSDMASSGNITSIDNGGADEVSSFLSLSPTLTSGQPISPRLRKNSF